MIYKHRMVVALPIAAAAATADAADAATTISAAGMTWTLLLLAVKKSLLSAFAPK